MASTKWLEQRKSDREPGRVLRAKNLHSEPAVIIANWPLISAREIASMIDMNAQTVVRRATELGLKSRPISARPG
jgi:hypothetical protein